MHGTYEAVMETPLTIELECISRSVPAFIRYDRFDSPAEGPEFEIQHIFVGENAEREVTYKQFIDFLGEKMADELIEMAMDEAVGTGDF